MPFRLVQRGKYWHIHGSHHGVSIRQSAKTANRREALAVKEKLEREIYAQTVLGQARPVGFAEAAAGYLEHGEGTYLLAALDAFKDRPVSTLRQADLDEAAKAAYPHGKPSTRNRKFYTPFIAVMNYAADQGWCERRKWRRPAQPEGRLDWRTPEEMEAFIAAAPWPLARNVIIYLGTMMRASEGVTLDRADASPDGWELTLWDTKGGYPRRVEVLSRAQPLIYEVEEGPVIRSADREPYHAYDALNLAIRRVCERSNLKHFSCHTLRHTGATWRLALDHDIPRLMANGGWKSVQMAMRYAHVSSSGLAEELERYGWQIRTKYAQSTRHKARVR